MKKIEDYIAELNTIDEHVRIEAKQCVDKIDKSVLESICAFSNEPDLGGGVIMMEVRLLMMEVRLLMMEAQPLMMEVRLLMMEARPLMMGVQTQRLGVQAQRLGVQAQRLGVQII